MAISLSFLQALYAFCLEGQTLRVAGLCTVWRFHGLFVPFTAVKLGVRLRSLLDVQCGSVGTIVSEFGFLFVLLLLCLPCFVRFVVASSLA